MGKVERMFSEKHHTSTIRAYGDAKLANVLFSVGLADRYKHLKAFSLHPGVVRTQFARNIKGFMKVLLSLFDKLMFITPDQGAKTSIYLCTAPDSALAAHNGAYFDKSKPSSRVSKEVTKQNATWLWEKSLPYLQKYL